MGFIRKILNKTSETAERISQPIKSIWSDNIISFIDIKTNYKHSSISFQLRKEKNEGIKYLMIEYRGPDGTVWAHLTAQDALMISRFIKENYEDNNFR